MYVHSKIRIVPVTPRTPEQNQALRAASRERILEAAMRLFGRLGYGAASIRLIAAEAGVAQGLMYSHFRDKEDLLRALFRRGMDDVRESFAAAASDSADSGRPALERLVRSAVAILRRNLDFWRLSYGVRMQEGVVKALGRDLEDWTREILAVLEGHFRKSGSGDPGIDAALFFAALDGVGQHFALDPEGYPVDAVAGALVERFTRGPASRTARRKARPGNAGRKTASGGKHGNPNRRR
jgi:AcrR family transcriptional regulator